MAAIFVKIGKKEDDYSENGEVYGVIDHNWKVLSDDQIQNLIEKLQTFKEKRKYSEKKPKKQINNSEFSEKIKDQFDNSKEENFEIVDETNKYYKTIKEKGMMAAILQLSVNTGLSNEEAGERLRKIIRQIEGKQTEHNGEGF